MADTIELNAGVRAAVDRDPASKVLERILNAVDATTQDAVTAAITDIYLAPAQATIAERRAALDDAEEKLQRGPITRTPKPVDLGGGQVR